MPITPEQAVEAIVEKNLRIADFWVSAHFWAPIEAAELLSKSRLDWQLELSQSLSTWIEPPERGMENAHQILAYTNLGALVEGTLKWFLSVYRETYTNDNNARKIKGKVVDPDGLTLHPLRQFFQNSVWASGDRWDSWIERVQQRRNAIHAFKDRDLGNHSEFLEDVIQYCDLLFYLDARVPYPD